MPEIFVDSLLDAVFDCLKVIPILFLAYLLVSYLSHDHSHKFSRFLAKAKKTSVFYAACLGCIPQCGFSSVIADLYSKRTVSLGTLIAVFVATSDEAIPIMLTNSDSILPMLLLVAIKVVLAVFFGYFVDLIFKKKDTLQVTSHKHHEHEEHEEHEESHAHSHIHECGHIHTDECSHECGHEHGCCADNIFLDAFMHTFNIVLYIFIATLILNCVIGYFGMGALENLLTSNKYLQVLIASLIGLIPNCASSVFLVELYLSSALCFPALLAGLTAGAGVGMIILWTKNKKHPLESFGIVAMQYVIGVASGMLLTLFY